MHDDLATRNLTLAALFAALTAVGALVSIPLIGPVPFTFQVLFVLLAGMVLGPRLGALSMLAYIALGLVAPVYAQGASGVGALFGPAGGYLWGFVLGAALVGLLARSAHGSVLRLFAAGLAGLVPVYVLGASWLAWQLGDGITRHLVWIGALQFLPLDIVKALAAALTARALASLPLGRPSLVRDR